MSRVQAAVGLGSNVGDRFAYLEGASHQLKETTGVQVIAQSAMYETAPVGHLEQAHFLNQAILLTTSLSPRALLQVLQDIEKMAGRTREIHWGPRTLDMDLLFYGDLIVADHDLQIPHPFLHQRAFVLIPLMDVAPDWVHPGLGKTILQLANEVDGKEGVHPWIQVS